jgi:pantoate--beta-alanine ligase
MKVFSSLYDFFHWRESLSKSLSIGFVPTMGALHDGHLSLVSGSLSDSNLTVVSIFVNPEQFSENEDFDTYPRTLSDDLNRLKQLGVDVVFTPGIKDIYNKRVNSFSLKDPFAETLEGAARPHFFPGVINVVSRLFNIVNPDFAYFGEKDAQQLLLIERLVSSAGFSIKIVRGKTVREKNGLAMSSRNQYLSPAAKGAASCLYRSLLLAKQLLLDGVVDSNIIKNEMSKIIEGEDAVVIDYISIVSLNSLREVNGRVLESVLISVAVVLEGVRLIDNLFYDSISRPMSTL